MPVMQPVLPLVQVNVLQVQTPQVSVREVPHPTSHFGGRFHYPRTCPAINWDCKRCGSLGHIARLCTRGTVNSVQTNNVQLEEPDTEVEFVIFLMESISFGRSNYVTLSSVSLISKVVVQALCANSEDVILPCLIFF